LKRSLSGAILGLIFIGIGIFFLIGSWYAYSDYIRIQKYDGRAIGKVTQKHFQTTADGGGNYTLDYSFADSSGTKIGGSNRVTKQQWDSLKDGDILEIVYDQSNPKRSIPLQNDGTSVVYAFLIFILGVVFSIFGILRFINSFRKKFNA
jgi:hypothetical protein